MRPPSLNKARNTKYAISADPKKDFRLHATKNTLNHTTPCLPSPKQVQEVHKLGLFRSGYSKWNHWKQYFYITTSKVSYSLIEPQLLPCTSTCSYKFHALPVHLHPTFLTPPIGGALGIQPNICGWAFVANIVNLFTPLAIFAKELRHGCLTRF